MVSDSFVSELNVLNVSRPTKKKKCISLLGTDSEMTLILKVSVNPKITFKDSRATFYEIFPLITTIPDTAPKNKTQIRENKNSPKAQRIIFTFSERHKYYVYGLTTEALNTKVI